MSKSILRQFLDNYWPTRKLLERDSHARRLEYYGLRREGVVSSWPEFEEYERRKDQEERERDVPG